MERHGFVLGPFIFGEGFNGAAGDLIASKQLEPRDAGTVVITELPFEV